MVFAGFCTVLALPAPATATEFRKGGTVEVPKDETVKGDIYIHAQHARIDGTVDGDVYVFCQQFDLNGHVSGDVIAFSQSSHIKGEIDGNLRSFNNNTTITGTVGKNVMLFNEVVTVDANAKIGRSFTGFVEGLSLDGNVGRDALLFFARANLSGKIGGGVRARGDSLEIGSAAVIEGPVKFEGNKPAEVSAGAKLASPVEFKQREHKPRYTQGHYYVWRIIWTAAFILFGMVLVLLAPKFAEETVRAAELYAAPIGLGVLVLFGVPIAAIIACVTVVGIPLGVLTLGFWMLMVCSAELVVGAVVGDWILGRARDTWGMIGRMSLGFVIVRIAYTAIEQVHVAGLLVGIGIWTWGMGAISLALYRRLAPVVTPSGPYTQPLPPGTTVGGVQPA